MTAYPENMRALSIAGAWGWLIAKGYKKYEYRTWQTNYRGPVLLHVSSSREWDNSFQEFGVPYEECPKSSVIGMATVTDCFFDEQQGFYAHEMTDPVLFSKPILDVKGARNYWKPKGSEHEQIFAKAWKLYQLGSKPPLQSPNFLGKKQLAPQTIAYGDFPHTVFAYALGYRTIILEPEPVNYRGKVLFTTCNCTDEEREEVYNALTAQGNSPEVLPPEDAMIGWADLVDVKLYTPETFQLDQNEHGYEESLEELKESMGWEQIYGCVLENGTFSETHLIDIGAAENVGFWMAENLKDLGTFQQSLELVYGS